MSISKSENILEALFAVLQTIEGVEVQRNTAVPVAIPESGLLILRDGEFGEAEGSLLNQHLLAQARSGNEKCSDDVAFL